MNPYFIDKSAMIKSLLLLFLIFFLSTMSHDREPMKAKFSNSASYRWLNKEIIEGYVLDDMESMDSWVAFAKGAQQVVDARVDFKASEASQQITRMTLTGERSHNGKHSLRMTIPTKLDIPGPKSGRGWGTAGVRRQFNGEDWRKSNRLSLWIYPDCPGF